ncbi:MAG: 2Fe-2S iron-sulfur cluster-binding protein [Pirellula sp.]|jgi:ferredoxin-NADP reductase|nr:2Fe-2S iron-sulfur cluster-binding protein [Pirellula sp.]
MSPWTFAPTLLLLASVILLLFALARSCVKSGLQNRRLERTNAVQTQRWDSEISGALQHAYITLAVTERAAEWFSTQVVRVDQESADVKSFYLVETSGSPLPRFLPGQHLLIERPPLDGLPTEFRCYSLSDDYQQSYWRISVKKNSVAPASVSRWLHEEIDVGDTVRVRGPSGSFYLQSCTKRHIVLLSAGIGITPMLPMLIETLKCSHDSVNLFAQYRDVDHMPFGEFLLNAAHNFPKARIHMWLSEFPRGVKGSSTNIIQQGKYTASDVCNSIEDLQRADFYLCGPEAWQTKLKNELVECGAIEKNVRFELFQESQTPEKPAEERKAAPCSVHFRQSNKLADFATTYPNLLGFATESHIPINSGCRTGACGTCAVKLLQGKVRYTRKPQFQLKTNEILPCVCVPDGNIVVDA